MTKFLSTAGATLAIAIALAAPAQAQLLRSGIGGGFGLGGGLPIGSIGSAGDIGVSGSVDHAARTVRSTTHVSLSTTAAVKAPKLAVPAVQANALVAPVSGLHGVAVPAIGEGVVALRGVRTVVVPAIPDLELRRSAIIESGIAPVAYADAPAYIDQQYVVLQSELRGTGVEVEKQGEQIVLELPSDVTFAFNKYDIQPRFYGVLTAVSRTLAKYPASYVDVNGHTDAIGSFGYNQVLSERRADTVADYMSVHQVNPARIHTQGFGKTEPIASNGTIAGRQANRRVEIILTPYVS